MATKNGDERTDGCTFQWKIKNISHCWLKFEESIDSPRFIADALEGTKWCLRFYPSGNTDEEYISLFLHREKDCVGPNKINVNHQLAILGKDGSILKAEIFSNRSFRKSDSWGFHDYEEREKIFVTEREAFLPEDTLTVQCTIWKTKAKPVKPQQLCARTVFEVNRRNFMWRMEKFSTLKCKRNKIKERLTEFHLALNEGEGLEKKLILNINSFDESIKYFSFTAFIITAEGKKESCGTYEYSGQKLRSEELWTLLSTQKLLENKSRYLPNDVLSLDCEYVYSNGAVSYEYFGCDIFPKLTNDVVERNIADDIGKQDTLNSPVLVNDLKSMYDDAICSDTEIRTLTQTFSVHKNILSARSPVFRSMFSHDMKEKNSGHVDVTDFEDDTVSRMLLYMYTDALNDLQFDSACKLYMMADKYEILSLKTRCSSILKGNLSPSKACDLLSLADRHQDDDLKCDVQSFILKHDREVFRSQEWKDFMATNIQLAADMMYRFTQCKTQEP